ncbi:hypothetical protein AMES_6710 [Amycolatopsis mediterranei S699]|uniref:Uncharacterized protein n=2 Tax=Amycolatopsis mediterranei TaxID=33910 RepID=A0A0H3DCU4_AMYMU|nr:hypothetical protein [Amycolatopsis mediterranei]ADJ48536.1 hypothetical protein AMED_6812 [Amycolatopsis mediterranei U32]AEK45464.1 hypothetical protein RAM_34955 [Amycolatopsis mediterranei S699]AFO80245.1 hypothetical protein AMES_6710 [Amycolatopsis mediterranei S699]AGT87373.1 hypothetical protein B737_6710 [Amycolatopsis mediterranei RB]KDO11073.1 hypothetical protein DV26_09555 [Amycolatopsis mediterranei]
MGIWEQTGSDVRLDWGTEGVAALGRECAVLVVVERPAAPSVTEIPPRTLLALTSPHGATVCDAAARVLAGTSATPPRRRETR